MCAHLRLTDQPAHPRISIRVYNGRSLNSHPRSLIRGFDGRSMSSHPRSLIRVFDRRSMSSHPRSLIRGFDGRSMSSHPRSLIRVFDRRSMSMYRSHYLWARYQSTHVIPQLLIQFYPESGIQNNKCTPVNIYGHGTNQQV